MTADRMFLSLPLTNSDVRPSNVLTDDDRVVPMHSFKHAATLQHIHPNNPHPLLLRVDKKAGHGAGKSVEKRSDLSCPTCFAKRILIICSTLSLEYRKRPTSGASLLRPWDWSGRTYRTICKGFYICSLLQFCFLLGYMVRGFTCSIYPTTIHGHWDL